MRRVLLAALCLASTTVRIAAADSGAVVVAVDDPALTYQGRFDRSRHGEARAAWPATSVALRFAGTAVAATLSTDDQDWVQVVVDGEPTRALQLAKSPTGTLLAEHLPPGEHVVEVVKRTEAWSVLSFAGFTLPAGGRALPAKPRPQRRIELYGDSITCGYGNEAHLGEPFSPATANAWLAYGPVAARLVGAECSVVAVSGIKLWPDNTLPPRHDDVLRPWDGAAKADLAAWVPQAVVIDLGTNDFGGAPEEHAWCDALRAFVATIRGHYPDCHVYLATGPMLADAPLATLKRWLDAVADAAATAGDRRIHRIDFAPQRASDGIGADGHPSVATHRLMAETLAAALKRDLGW